MGQTDANNEGIINKPNIILDIVYLLIATICYVQYCVIGAAVTIGVLDAFVILLTSYIVYIYIFCFSGNNLKKRFSLFAFITAFFILLVGRYITHLGDEKSYGVFVFTKVSSISYSNEAKGLLLMLISLIFVSISYKSKIKFALNTENDTLKSSPPKQRNDKIEYYTRLTMILGGVAAFIKLLGKVYYVATHGYLASYTNVGGSLYNNPIIDMVDGFYLIGLYGYLACFPSKKAVRGSIAVYLLYNLLSLLTGVRGDLVVGLLFIVWYYFKREQVFPNEGITFNRNKVFLLGIIALFLSNFLLDYGYTRVGKSSVDSSFGNKILTFISSQGGSGKLISLSIENENEILQYISRPMILFAPLRNFMINNSLFRMFTGGALGQSVDNLHRTGSLNGILTYVTNPESYLAGAGLGTCYISELFLSFGIFGVIVFNIILGKLFQKMDNIQYEKTWSQIIILFRAFTILVYIPRHSVLQIIPECFVLFLYVFMLKKIT